MTPEPDAVPWVKHADLPPKPALPPAPTPEPIQINLGPAPKGKSAWVIVTTSDAKNPRDWPAHVTWSGSKDKPNKSDDPRPFVDMEASGPAWYGDRELWAGLWLSDNGANPQTVLHEINFAVSRGCKAVLLHCDDTDSAGGEQVRNVAAAAELVDGHGLTPVILAHAVEDKATFLRGQAQLRELNRRMGRTLNLRPDGKDHEKQAQTIRTFCELVEPNDIVVFYGDLDRLRALWPDAARYIEEFIANTQRPAYAPWETPLVAKPEEPKPAPTWPTRPTTPGGKGKGDKELVIAAVSFGLVPFFRWLWGRRKKA
jgi:hypothetical protein